MRSRVFQSTRPRGARHGIETAMQFVNGVSIHAPAWGATFNSSSERSFSSGFNPRARVGRDPVNGNFAALGMGFNPRARVGRDRAR